MVAKTIDWYIYFLTVVAKRKSTLKTRISPLGVDMGKKMNHVMVLYLLYLSNSSLGKYVVPVCHVTYIHEASKNLVATK